MAAQASLTLTDAAGTPVNHTYSPVGIDSAGIAKWADRAGGVFLGFPSFTMAMRYPSKSVRTTKVTLKLVLPTLADGLKVYDCLGTVDIVLPEQATLQERKDLLALLRDALGDAIITSAVHDLENVY